MQFEDFTKIVDKVVENQYVWKGKETYEKYDPFANYPRFHTSMDLSELPGSEEYSEQWRLVIRLIEKMDWVDKIRALIFLQEYPDGKYWPEKREMEFKKDMAHISKIVNGTHFKNSVEEFVPKRDSRERFKCTTPDIFQNECSFKFERSIPPFSK